MEFLWAHDLLDTVEISSGQSLLKFLTCSGGFIAMVTSVTVTSKLVEGA